MKAMDLPAAKQEEIFRDLIRHILSQGGSILSNQLAPFYTEHPQHKGLVKNMKSFCEQYPHSIAVRMGDGQRCDYSLEVSAMPSGNSPDGLSAQKREEILQDLILFIKERGGSVGTEELQPFFERHPGHRELMQKVSKFCKQHPKQIVVGPGNAPHLRLSFPSTKTQAPAVEWRVQCFEGVLSSYLGFPRLLLRSSLVSQVHDR